MIFLGSTALGGLAWRAILEKWFKSFRPFRSRECNHECETKAALQKPTAARTHQPRAARPDPHSGPSIPAQCRGVGGGAPGRGSNREPCTRSRWSTTRAADTDRRTLLVCSGAGDQARGYRPGGELRTVNPGAGAYETGASALGEGPTMATRPTAAASNQTRGLSK